MIRKSGGYTSTLLKQIHARETRIPISNSLIYKPIWVSGLVSGVCARMCACVWCVGKLAMGVRLCILFPYNQKILAKGKARPHRGLNPGPVAHIGDYYDVYQGVFNPCFYSWERTPALSIPASTG